MERTMIICWKWDAWNQPLVEEHLKNGPTVLPEDVYDEYIVHQPNEECAEEPIARVVRARIKYSSGDIKVLAWLKAIINKYKTKDNQVFLFLHRRDGFTNATIELINKWELIDRCFLFGGGKNDFIYYMVDNAGLLGEDGAFHWQQPSKEQREIAVADEEKKRVFQPYFDKTWYYYEFEFYNKIFELKEEVMSYFYPMLDGGNPIWSMVDYSEKLGANKLLYLRVKSFMNDECNCLSEGEIKELQKYEQDHRKSYQLDDCRANLKKLGDVGEEYDDVIRYFQQMMGKGHNKLTGHVRQDLQEMNREFEELLEAIKCQYQGI